LGDAVTGRLVPTRLLPTLASVFVAAAVLSACSSDNKTVLTVGTYQGRKGEYPTIQAAVDHAKKGDWILIGPGDYHETADAGGAQGSPQQGDMGGVYISTPGIHLRGMDRNGVVVDGTKPGASQCSANESDQNFGPLGSDGKAVGRNGILIWKASSVSVDNLTVCNFLAGTGDSGNQVWWNGGADSGQIGMTGYSGSYLTTTSTYFGGESTASQYGIFAGNAAGPATWDQLYASNMNDSGAYVGACQQQCDVTIDHAWFEFSALGYSGTNSGGAVVMENSQFDNNQDGLDTNTQIKGDAPAPQNGTCPGGATSPVSHTQSCWVFLNNYVHDNNNPSVPASGGAAGGPVGTGMTVSGGTHDTLMGNRFENNGAWGVLFVPYADSNPPSNGQTCGGGGGQDVSGFGCVLDPKGDALIGNTFMHNGYFGNPSNADFGQITLFGGEPQNCYRNNTAPAGSAPPGLEATQPTCGETTKAGNTGGALFNQVLCDTHIGACPPGAKYPARTAVVMHPLPSGLPTMPNPCAGVPSGGWCTGGHPVTGAAAIGGVGGMALVAMAPGVYSIRRNRRSRRFGAE
jgi:hypothetical protein